MNPLVYPAIDLIDGQCVRLWKGQFERVTVFEESPADIAARYATAGADVLHVVDLEGARLGEPQNLETLRMIREAAPTLDIQWGGGMRSREAIESALAIGACRVLVGSLAVTEPQRVGEWVQVFGAKRIVAAVDVRAIVDASAIAPVIASASAPVIAGEAKQSHARRSTLDDPVPRTTYLPATSGWTSQSDRDLWSVLDELVGFGLTHVLSTDIDRDGTGTGPNLTLYRELVARYPQLNVQASGGVHSVEDLQDLAATGVSAVVIGRALLDGTLKPESVLC
jgi:phosphoribosylformimino-5-aminoimidazole carboxamide ribotide isomerase